MSDEIAQEIKTVDTAEAPKVAAAPKFGEKTIGIASVVFSAVALGVLYLL
ncbi:MAG: hypothetical protein HY366_03420 [Candidatus Aenigmarchaeota archaeon]|nr:hypothetical protein [Candidatus Aenigmarchaeota archaeon]